MGNEKNGNGFVSTQFVLDSPGRVAGSGERLDPGFNGVLGG